MIDDKKLWEIYPNIWATESAYMSWLRGGIRRYLWAKNPVKLEFIKQNRVKIPNPNPKGKVKEVWGGVCALTGNIFPIGDMEVDHKEGNHSLKTLDDLVPFVKGIVMITLDDLQLVSKEALQAVADSYKLLYPETKMFKGWRGDEFEIDWKYVFNENWDMARMLRWENDVVVGTDVMRSLNVL